MGKWTKSRYQTFQNLNVPYAMQKLDPHQTASHCGITTRELFGMRGNGRIGMKFFQFDHTEKDFKARNFCYRADIPQLKAEIAKGKPGAVTHKLPAQPLVTFEEIAQELGCSLKHLQNRHYRNRWPALYAPTYEATNPGEKNLAKPAKFARGVIEELRRTPIGATVYKPATQQEETPMYRTPQNNEPGYLSTKQIAALVGCKPYTIHNLMASRRAPKGFSMRKIGNLYLYEEKMVDAVREAMAKSKQLGRPKNAPRPVVVGTANPYNDARNEARPAPVASPPTPWVSIACELIENGFKDAGVYLIKKYA